MYSIYKYLSSAILHGSVFSLQNYSLAGVTLLESMLQTWVMCSKQTRVSRWFPTHLVPITGKVVKFTAHVNCDLHYVNFSLHVS